MNQAQKQAMSATVVRVGPLISMLERVMRNEIAEALAPLDLTLQQFVTLLVLDSRGLLSNAELARISHMSPQSANKTVKALAANGYITHRQDPQHKRILLLAITRRGRSVLKKADKSVQGVEARMQASKSLKEQKQLQAQLLDCLHALGVSLPQ